MTISRDQVAECYQLAMTAYRCDIKREELNAWLAVLGAADIDGDVAVTVTVRMCMRPGQWPPTPGDVVGETLAVMGRPPAPAIDAAVGYYLAGDWDVHPAVAQAARAVWWDRVAAEAQAVRQFRQLYAAALDDTVRRPAPAVRRSEPAAIRESVQRAITRG
ncbi:MAG TPA: hypothetical protein VD764_08945, partial [Nocardioides sp.]|nr:hypothetical protein [Nocardioides sp.]